ncbi:PREDICTED: 39S ribosomal protein L2, mitochondrial-like [Priapulus caudatus]|uniref:39S ribosomal protein L2, mitochondrial-like n=1 Tax=Priapulus caudatus TaxID=37621 RepID=A0ABM1F5P1_PRICU|nr:PREDICTED: 39S ribosomal protein L2, mitochondrial-like [Priapulus caudatus]XP_014679762.1 PREDICTED: 39S ribosomal protein L2, mitochondrial-like [Priapulus caudatus]XP_014679763.1 PREDICTED: 39S ribosomal protein L2, mitochondrial-like [Priapulus caudatus]
MLASTLARSLQRLTIRVAAATQPSLRPSLTTTAASSRLLPAASLQQTPSFVAQSSAPLARGFHTTTPLCKKLRGRKHKVHLRFQRRVIVTKMPASGYTTKALPCTKTGGRDLVTGRVVNHRRAGGNKVKFRMVDMHRIGPTEGEPLQEKVMSIHYDPLRSAKIALVAGGDKKRFILATCNMKAGDIINTSGHIPRIPVKAYEGDAYPLGALPVGTVVCCVERYPGDGGKVVRAAGTSTTILRRVAGGDVIVQLPSRREMRVSERCVAVVGRVSNPDHDKLTRGSPQASRWLGYRPKSGWRQKKTGYHGRKLRRPKPARVYDAPPVRAYSVHQLNL